MPIKTSIIIPIYNTEKYLDECIQSVLNQTQQEIEIILVDDGSTDNSKIIIEEYERKYAKITAVYQMNQKQGAARNAGVRIAQGKYIYFLDSDDYITEDMIEQCYNYAEINNLDFLSFDACAFCEEDVSDISYNMENVYNRSKVGITGEILSGKEYWLRYFNKGGVYLCAPLTYINKEFYLKNQLDFREGIFYEDNDWIARMYIAAKRVGYLQRKLYYRRYRNNSTTVGKYSYFHATSCICNVLFLDKMLLNAEDFASKCISNSILKRQLFRMGDVIKYLYKEQQLESIAEELVTFCIKVLADKEQLWDVDKSIYVELVYLIETICQHVKGKSVLIKQLLQQLRDDKKKICNYWIENFRLQDGIKIGIYGSGKTCGLLLEWYEQQGIEIAAEICFIDSNKTSGVYRGYPIFNVKEIRKLNLEHILIASVRYQDEMLQRLHAMGIENDKIFMVPDRLI